MISIQTYKILWPLMHIALTMAQILMQHIESAEALCIDAVHSISYSTEY